MMSVCAFCHNRWIDCDVQTLINYPQPQRETERQRKGFIEWWTIYIYCINTKVYKIDWNRRQMTVKWMLAFLTKQIELPHCEPNAKKRPSVEILMKFVEKIDRTSYSECKSGKWVKKMHLDCFAVHFFGSNIQTNHSSGQTIILIKSWISTEANIFDRMHSPQSPVASFIQ